MNVRTARRAAALSTLLLLAACGPQANTEELDSATGVTVEEAPADMSGQLPADGGERAAEQPAATDESAETDLLTITLPSIFPDANEAQAQIMQYIGQDGGIYFDLDAASEQCRASLESIGIVPEDATVEELPVSCSPYIVDPPDADPIPVARNEDGTYTFTITEDEQQLAIERIEGQLDILATVTPGVASIIYDDALTDIRIVAESETAAEQAAYSAFFYMRLHRAFTRTGEDIPLTIVTEDTAGTPYEAYTTTRELVLLPVGP